MMLPVRGGRRQMMLMVQLMMMRMMGGDGAAIKDILDEERRPTGGGSVLTWLSLLLLTGGRLHLPFLALCTQLCTRLGRTDCAVTSSPRSLKAKSYAPRSKVIARRRAIPRTVSSLASIAESV